jgi:chromate reductase
MAQNSESKPIHVLGISGSLRKASFNSAALRAASELLPAGMTLEIYNEIGAFPLYNDDVKALGFPTIVGEFGRRIAAADALLIVTPEYNYSVPGALKNAIDWASRLPEQPFNKKPVAMMGASTGMLGTVRAQLHLRHICVYVNMFPLNKPEVFITKAAEKFDAQGKLTDEPTREQIRKLLVSLDGWARQLRGKNPLPA